MYVDIKAILYWNHKYNNKPKSKKYHQESTISTVSKLGNQWEQQLPQMTNQKDQQFLQLGKQGVNCFCNWWIRRGSHFIWWCVRDDNQRRRWGNCFKLRRRRWIHPWRLWVSWLWIACTDVGSGGAASLGLTKGSWSSAQATFSRKCSIDMIGLLWANSCRLCMIINYPRNKLCSIGTKVSELWTSFLTVTDGGAGVDDEGMSSVLALFLDVICN